MDITPFLRIQIKIQHGQNFSNPFFKYDSNKIFLHFLLLSSCPRLSFIMIQHCKKIQNKYKTVSQRQRHHNPTSSCQAPSIKYNILPKAITHHIFGKHGIGSSKTVLYILLFKANQNYGAAQVSVWHNEAEKFSVRGTMCNNNYVHGWSVGPR